MLFLLVGSDHNLRKLEKKRQQPHSILEPSLQNTSTISIAAGIHHNGALEHSEVRSRDGSPIPNFDDELTGHMDESVAGAAVPLSKQEVPLLDYIHHIMRFLQGLLGNSSHVEVFNGLSELHLLDQLLNVFKMCSLPVSFNRSSAAEELRTVFAHLNEQNQETIIPISQAFQVALLDEHAKSFLEQIFLADPKYLVTFTEEHPSVRALCAIERLAEVFALSVRESFHQGYVDQLATLVLEGHSTFNLLATIKRGLLFAIKFATRMHNSVVQPPTNDPTKSNDQCAQETKPIPNQLPEVDVATLLPKSQIDGFSKLLETLNSVYRSVSAVISQFGRIFQRHTFDVSSDTDKMLGIIVSTFSQSIDAARTSTRESLHSSTAIIIWADFVSSTVTDMQSFLLSPSSNRHGSDKGAPNLPLLQAFDHCNIFQVCRFFLFLFFRFFI
jgi:hypothetical protein